MLVAGGLDPSVDQHDQVLRQPQRLVAVVRHEQRRRIERRQHLRQLVEQPRVGAFIESRERLVEQHERRAQTQRARQAHSSSFAAGEAIGLPVEQVSDAEQRGGVGDAGPPLRGVDAAQPQTQLEVVANRLPQEHLFLEDERHIRSRPRCRAACRQCAPVRCADARDPQ